MKIRSAILISSLLGLLLVSMAAVGIEKEAQTPGRLLTGRVVDKQDNVLPNAIVYVTDTRSRAVKTYIVGPDGNYRFPALSTTVDYEVYAQYNGRSSDTKRISQFDDRKLLNIILKIDTK